MRRATTLTIIVSLCMAVAACGADRSPVDDRANPRAGEGRVEGRGAETAEWAARLPRAEWSAFQRVLPDEEWFEVFRIAPRVHAIYEPKQFEEVISFLIEGDDFALLIDTGLGIGDIKNVVDRLTDRQVIVVNSHSHYDHVGGNHQFPLIASIDNDYSRGRSGGARGDDVSEFVAPAWVAGPFPDGFNPDTYAILPWTPSSTVADGDVIDLGGISLEVLHLPGHAPDAIALLDRANRRIFVGDIFYLAPLYAHLDGSDVNQYRKSARRLADLADEVDAVMTAHNVPTVKPDYLRQMAAAFEAIADGSADYVATDGAREYDFGDFSILTPEPASDVASTAGEDTE